MERRVPITVEAAVRKVMGFADKGLKELLPIELTYGRILAEDLVAEHDVRSLLCKNCSFTSIFTLKRNIVARFE